MIDQDLAQTVSPGEPSCGDVNKVKNVRNTTLQPLFKQLAGKHFKDFSLNSSPPQPLYTH